MSTIVASSASVSVAAAAAAANAANIAAQQRKNKEKNKHGCAVDYVSPYSNCPSNADDPHGYSECIALIGVPEHDPSGMEAVGFICTGLLIIFVVGFAINKFATS